MTDPARQSRLLTKRGALRGWFLAHLPTDCQHANRLKIARNNANNFNGVPYGIRTRVTAVDCGRQALSIGYAAN
jgi:hypothetical protein